MRLVVALMFVALPLAGCVTDEPTDIKFGGDDGVDPISEETVEIDGEQVAVNRGSVAGTVLNEQGKPVPEARVFLVATAHEQQTSFDGEFKFLNVTTGDHLVRAEHPDLPAAEVSIVVVAGEQVEVALTMLREGNPNLSLHVHNMWNGRSEVTIMDQTVPLFPNSAATSASDLASRSILWANFKRDAYRFDIVLPAEAPGGGRALIFPGSTEIEVTVTWDSADITHEKLQLHVAKAEPEDLPLQSSGDPWIIPVEPGTWDRGHQEFTHWTFELSTANEITEAPNYSPGIIMPQSEVQVKMVIRGGDPPLEPAHADFWEDNSTIEMEIEGSPNPAVTVFYRRPDGSGTRLSPRDIIPPGTGHIRAEFSWTNPNFDGTLPGQDWAITWRTADQHPYNTPFDEWRRVPFSEGSGSEQRKVYEFDVEPEWTDAWYQSRSIWSFLVSREGAQDDYEYFQEQRWPQNVPTFTLKLTLTKDGA